jgi:hypothetical protein
MEAINITGHHLAGTGLIEGPDQRSFYHFSDSGELGFCTRIGWESGEFFDLNREL